MRPSDVRITGVPNDRLSELADLGRRTFIESYSDEDDPSGFHGYVDEAFAADTIVSSAAEPGTHFRWVLVDDEPVAYAKVDAATLPGDVERPAEGFSAHLHRLYVLAAHQGRGLGAALLRDAFMVGAADGATHLWLSVWERNVAAIGFYERQGLRRLGTSPFQIGNELHCDLVMGKVLSPVLDPPG